jgi:aspartyl-tRNA(Asn)/glutamyl-tRNA(Gln) amidotransferase subunit A
LRSLLETSEAIRTGRASSFEVTEECLARIVKLNPRVNAFITVTTDLAREQARRADKEIREGKWRGPLHGVPIGLKDLIDTAEILTTAGSRQYEKRVPTESAPVWRLLESAGAVLLGKQNLHEFAYGGSSIVSAYGAVHNAWNPDAIAGGSSGGSAVAVALGMGYAAIGTDTAGSIREPAALSGVVGLKPTYGRVSAQGVVPLSPSLDHVGPLTRSVLDAAIVLDAISESRSGRSPAVGLGSSTRLLDEARQSPQALRVGVPREYFFAKIDSEVERALEQAIHVIRGLVAEVRDVELHPDPDASFQGTEMYEVHRSFLQTSSELYQPETLRRLRAVSNIPAEKKTAGRLALQTAREEIPRFFEHTDLLVTPTTPIPAPMIAKLEAQPEQLRPTEILLLRNTRPFNMWGLPAISVPCGFSSAGLPIGLQIAGAPWREDRVLCLAHAYERATEWHLRTPELAKK